MARIDTVAHFCTDVANAIRRKTGRSALIKASDFDTEILSIEGGSEPTEPIKENDINFYDYDGTLLYSYSANDFLELEELPTNPEHEHLISQGWNWTLEDAKTQVESEGMVDIGQMYTTKNNSTNVYIKLEDDRLEPYFNVILNGTINVDWGDGTTSSITGTSTATTDIVYTKHVYSQKGEYVIKITGDNFIIPGDSYATLFITKDTTTHNSSNQYRDRVYSAAIEKIELGTNVTLSNYCFRHCDKLKVLLIPFNLSTVSYGMCWNCPSLQYIIIPSGTSIERYIFSGCLSLKGVSLPKSVTLITQSMFQDCQSLQRVVIPYSTTIINAAAFSGCSSLKTINIPSSLTSIGNQAFANCWGFQSFNCPSSLTQLNNGVFQYCYNLAIVRISLNVANIYGTCFDNCRGVKTYDFSNYTSIPTLRATNAFNNQADDYQILVPSDLYEDWIAASNWSSISDHIIAVESEE